MADAATFVEYLQKTIKGAESSKAIVASGSYGGFLATVFRQNHPEAFFGAIASAPPIEGLIDDSSDPYRYNWNIWLNNVYQDRSVLACSKIKNAFLVLKQRFASGNLSSLKQELGLCSIPTDDQFIQLSFWMQNVYSNAAELNYAALRPGRAPTTLAFDKVIDIALKQDDPIQILNETLWLWYGPSPDFGLPCINITTPIASVSVPLIESTIFEYIVCESWQIRLILVAHKSPKHNLLQAALTLLTSRQILPPPKSIHCTRRNDFSRLRPRLLSPGMRQALQYHHTPRRRAPPQIQLYGCRPAQKHSNHLVSGSV